MRLICFFLYSFLTLLGGAEYCNKESKTDCEDFQGPGKKSAALGWFTLCLNFIGSDSSFFFCLIVNHVIIAELNDIGSAVLGDTGKRDREMPKKDR